MMTAQAEGGGGLAVGGGYLQGANQATLACQDRADPYAKPLAPRHAHNQTGRVISIPTSAVVTCITVAATPKAAEIK
jgi:hypothetical protein